MPKVFSMEMGVPGLSISINYNAGNLRLTSVDWALPGSGAVARVRIWDAGALVYDRTVAGPATGAETIPGNYRVRQVTEDGETFYDLPASLTWQINVETIGG